VTAVSNSAVARQLNTFLVSKGGQPIPGLENLDPKKLHKLQQGMQEFLDTYDNSETDLGHLVGNNALESMRDMTKLLSQQGGGPARGALRVGMCGGGGARAACPPDPPPAPVVVSPERRSSAAASAQVSSATGNCATFSPLAASFVSASALVSSARSSPTAGYNPLAVLNQATGLAQTSGRHGLSSASGVDPNLESLQAAGGGGGFFEDKVFTLMIKIVADMQKQVEERLKKLQDQAAAAEKGGGKKGGKGGFLGGVVKGVVGIAAPIVGTALGGPVGGMIGKAVGNAVTGGGSGSGGIGGGGGGGAGGGQESRNIEFEKIKFDMQKLSQMQQALSNILNTLDELAKSAIRAIKAG
jgi:hypothetical protein